MESKKNFDVTRDSQYRNSFRGKPFFIHFASAKAERISCRSALIFSKVPGGGISRRSSLESNLILETLICSHSNGLYWPEEPVELHRDSIVVVNPVKFTPHQPVTEPLFEAEDRAKIGQHHSTA